MRARRLGGALLLVFGIVGVAACSPSIKGDTARQGYCYSARLDFEKVMHTAVDPLAKARDRSSARSILRLFASNGREWIGDAPARLVPASRTLVRAVRSAVSGNGLVLADAGVDAALRDVAEYADGCVRT
jgi:hypothetical protein